MSESLEGEEWRPVTVEPYGEHYDVSNLGRVRRRTPRPSRGRGIRPGGLLKPSLSSTGYVDVAFSSGGTASYHNLVHHLVAGAFIGPRPDGMVINHKDGNKSNNCADNLEYVTQKQNSVHSYETGMSPCGSRHYKAKLNTETLAKCRALRARGMMWKDIAVELGVSKNTVYRAFHGETYKREPA